MFFSVSHLLLIAVAAIWGFAFVAQSAGMDHLGPHSFNAARFLLATLSLLPLWFMMRHKREKQGKALIWGGIAAGIVMFGGFTMQQVGLLDTTAGNAGFITGMYIVLVPIAGVLLGHSTNMQTWAGLILAVLGLYSLTIGPNFSMGQGDLLVLVGAFFWTGHVLIIGWISRKVDAISLSIVQFVVATALATGFAVALETPEMGGFTSAWLPLVYAGVASSGIAFTLQAIAQRKVEPSVTALILSTEAVFAVLGGCLLLDEPFGAKEALGCGLMMIGMVVTQWPVKRSNDVVAEPLS
ncbi:DMT family transporter [Neptunomonas sp. XY-337]|uniref:DMT family transporter n=1 Tax=Neptunomonas sp. XY-337 TaxID=2561897 RepID=UPI0010AA367D|nr:DMT family transporter [Neptunomonas sp. XY-337]